MGKQRQLVVDLYKAGKSAKEAIATLNDIYGDESLHRGQVYRIFVDLKRGENGSDKRGWNTEKRVRVEKNIEAVRSMINDDRRVTIVDIEMATGLSRGTINRILHDDLRLSKLSARWVPHLLTDKHKAERIRCAKKFLKSHFECGKAFLDKIVTVDETWVSFTTPETKQQSRQWLPRGCGPPRKAKVIASDKKVMVIAFFDNRGLIYTHYVPKGKTINANYYIDVLRTFQQHLRHKRPTMLENGWFLHHDNARPHTAMATVDYMCQKGIKTIDHPPYSPDLAPCDFFLFPKVKTDMAGTVCATLSDVKKLWEGSVKAITEEEFSAVFEKWSER